MSLAPRVGGGDRPSPTGNRPSLILGIDEQDLKSGVLGLVVALVEIIVEALRHQALRRVEGGGLTEVEVERLGSALLELDAAIDMLKLEQGIAESVKAVRDGLDKIVDEALEGALDPQRWSQPGDPPNQLRHPIPAAV